MGILEADLGQNGIASGAQSDRVQIDSWCRLICCNAAGRGSSPPTIKPRLSAVWETPTNSERHEPPAGCHLPSSVATRFRFTSEFRSGRAYNLASGSQSRATVTGRPTGGARPRCAVPELDCLAPKTAAAAITMHDWQSASCCSAARHQGDLPRRYKGQNRSLDAFLADRLRTATAHDVRRQ